MIACVYLGYVSLKTNLGTLNLEVYCDSVPLASENFIRLCERGYYNNTVFHRSIRHFMVGIFVAPVLLLLPYLSLT